MREVARGAEEDHRVRVRDALEAEALAERVGVDLRRGVAVGSSDPSAARGWSAGCVASGDRRRGPWTQSTLRPTRDVAAPTRPRSRSSGPSAERERPLERRQVGRVVGAQAEPEDRQVVRPERLGVALGLGVDQPAERVRPAGDLAVARVLGGQLEEPARSAPRPCGAGRSSAGTAGRSRRWSPSASDRGRGRGCGRTPASRLGARGDECLDRDVLAGVTAHRRGSTG